MLRLLPLLIALSALPASAAIYKWVDKNGKLQYSDKPPPTQTKQGVTELNKQGMTVKQTEGILTPEQKAVRDAELAKAREEKQKLDEAHRRDRALLDTFSNTSEIDRIRDQNLEQINATIQSEQSRLEAVDHRIEEYQKQVDRYAKAKKPTAPPPELLNDMAERKAEAAKIAAGIQQRKQEALDVKARAEADKKRLVQLRGPSALSK